MTMKKSPPNLRSVRARLVLEKLSQSLASDVLADGTIAAEFEIALSRPIRLTDTFVVSRPRLFNAFRRALQGKAVRLYPDKKSPRKTARVTIWEDGSGMVAIGDQNLRFECVGLLSRSRLARTDAFNQLMVRHTLAKEHRETVRALISQPSFSDSDFLECVGIIGTTPESFLETLAPLARARKISIGDLLPERTPHWDNLIGVPSGDSSLQEFINGALRDRQRQLTVGDSSRAMWALSLAFCAPELVPHDIFAELETDILVKMLAEATTFADHFGLVGAFEICAQSCQRDHRFDSIGSRLLEALFSDQDQLANRCWCFGVGVVLATARLHQHAEMRRRPALWRRLVSTAYASLVVRALGPSNINGELLFKWSMQVSGKAFIGSAALDRAYLPKWLPDWLVPRMLVPDAIGRVEAALKKIPEDYVNPEWVRLVREARAQLGDAGEMFMSYPAIGQGERRPPIDLKNAGDLTRLYKRLIDDPTIENLVGLAPFFYSFGVPSECVAPTLLTIKRLRDNLSRWTDPMIQTAIQVATFIAVERRASDLADAIAECLIPAEAHLSDDFSTSEIVMRLVECAAAGEDHEKQLEVLARRLERVAFLAAPDNSADLHDTLRVLQSLDPKLASLLGRAVATSRLGQKAA